MWRVRREGRRSALIRSDFGLCEGGVFSCSLGLIREAGIEACWLPQHYYAIPNPKSGIDENVFDAFGL